MMGLFEVTCLLIGAVCGNLGAVLVPSFNLGLFWNTVLGSVGAYAGLRLLPHVEIDRVGHWTTDFLAAGASGMTVMLIAGGIVELVYRRR